jgi:PAS domain-containing protein
MSGDAEIEFAGGMAVLAVSAGSAHLVWADAQFVDEFPGAVPGAAAFGDDAPQGLLAAAAQIGEGTTQRVACPAAILFGSAMGGHLDAVVQLVGLGGGRVLLALPVAAENAAQEAEASLAETLDAVPIAVALVAVADGTILWLNTPFRELLDGSEFDLMGTSLAAHFGLPGAFKTLIAATGPFAASAPLPTPLKTLSGIMTPVVATAKRVTFRRQEAALVCLSHGF